MTLADSTYRITGTCYSVPAQLVAMTDLLNAGIPIYGIPAVHQPEDVYVSVAPEIAEELQRRLADAGHQLPHHGVLVEVSLTRHEATGG